MTYKELKETLAKIYSVKTVATGYSYWVYTLLEKCLNMFIYEGLPETLPAEEIEERLIMTGYAGIFKHNKFGLVTSYGGIFGVDMYKKPTSFTYAQPILGGSTLKINKDCAMIYNAESDTLIQRGLSELIYRYARMLADFDSSINIFTINTRAISLNVAKTEQVATSVDSVMKKIEAGESACISDNTILDCFKTFPYANQSGNNTMTELLSARDSCLRNFYQEIGIKSAYQKKERMITDEVTSDNQILLINLNDMLKQRQKGIEQVNKLFGTKISVKLSPDFDITNYEEEKENEIV